MRTQIERRTSQRAQRSLRRSRIVHVDPHGVRRDRDRSRSGRTERGRSPGRRRSAHPAGGDGQVGGTCLNHGCRPTKALRASAVVAHQARRAAEFGVHTGEVRVDFPIAIQRVHTLIDGMREGLHDWLARRRRTGPGQPAPRPWSATPPVGPHQVRIGDETHTTGKVYLDIGGRAAVPTIEGLDTVELPDRGRAARPDRAAPAPGDRGRRLHRAGVRPDVPPVRRRGDDPGRRRDRRPRGSRCGRRR